MMVRLSLAAVALGLAALMVAPGSASACTCVHESTESKLASTEHAVIAKLVDVRYISNPKGAVGEAVFVYKLRRVIKGGDHLREKRRLKLRSDTGGAVCGLPRRHPKRYGLFLYRVGSGRLFSNSCNVVSPKAMRRAARGMDDGAQLAALRSAPCPASRA